MTVRTTIRTDIDTRRLSDHARRSDTPARRRIAAIAVYLPELYWAAGSITCLATLAPMQVPGIVLWFFALPGLAALAHIGLVENTRRRGNREVLRIREEREQAAARAEFAEQVAAEQADTTDTDSDPAADRARVIQGEVA